MKYLYRYRPCGMPEGELEVFFSSFRLAKEFMLKESNYHV